MADSDPKRPFGVTPGYVVTGKIPSEDERKRTNQQRNWQAWQEASLDVQQQMADILRGRQDIIGRQEQDKGFNWVHEGNTLQATDDAGNKINFGTISQEDAKTLMDHGASAGELQNLGHYGARSMIAAQVAREVEDLGMALQNAGIPSTVGDVPLERLIAQLGDRAPQAAAQMQALLAAGARAVSGYQEWATMPGADESDREPLQYFPGFTEYTYNNLTLFYNAAGEFL